MKELSLMNIWMIDSLFGLFSKDLGIDLGSGGNSELPAPVIAAFDLAVGTVSGRQYQPSR